MSEKKGTLRHKATGVEFKNVFLVGKGWDAVNVRLVEGANPNSFSDDQWEFVATVKPLPTTSDTLTIIAAGYYPMVRTDGKKWYQVTWASPGHTLTKTTEEAALYRLSLAGSRLFEGTKELNREDYIQ